MGAQGNGGIGWCDFTFNPWVGCLKVSPACAHCYAESLDHRWGNDRWGADKQRGVTSESHWQQPRAWNRKAQRDVKRYRVFCGSMCDVMEDRPDLYAVRERLFRLIGDTRNIDWLLLTKRPDNFARFLPWGDNTRMFGAASGPWPNVWLGTTVENQEYADKRIPHLLSTPAAVRFVSYEPALGPINFDEFMWLYDESGRTRRRMPLGGWDCPQPLGWVIAGGESGPGARPSHLDWFRSARDQCAAAGTPFYFKQHGEWVALPVNQIPVDGGDFKLVSIDERKPFSSGFFNQSHALHSMLTNPFYGWQLPVVKVGKKAAGRLLDGVEHSEFPEVSE